MLRRKLTQQITQANIYLAGCGKGRMLASVWLPVSKYVLAVDCDAAKIQYVRYHYPTIDVRVDDCTRFNDWPRGVQFQIADFDAYGSPYDGVDNFFAGADWQTPFWAFVTDGTPLWLGRGGVLPKQLRSEDVPRPVCDPQVRRTYFETLVWPRWNDLAQGFGLRITGRSCTWKKGKTVAYYAVRLEV